MRPYYATVVTVTAVTLTYNYKMNEQEIRRNKALFQLKTRSTRLVK